MTELHVGSYPGTDRRADANQADEQGQGGSGQAQGRVIDCTQAVQALHGTQREKTHAPLFIHITRS